MMTLQAVLLTISLLCGSLCAASSGAENDVVLPDVGDDFVMNPVRPKGSEDDGILEFHFWPRAQVRDLLVRHRETLGLDPDLFYRKNIIGGSLEGLAIDDHQWKAAVESGAFQSTVLQILGLEDEKTRKALRRIVEAEKMAIRNAKLHKRRQKELKAKLDAVREEDLERLKAKELQSLFRDLGGDLSQVGREKSELLVAVKAALRTMRGERNEL